MHTVALTANTELIERKRECKKVIFPFFATKSYRIPPRSKRCTDKVSITTMSLTFNIGCHKVFIFASAATSLKNIKIWQTCQKFLTLVSFFTTFVKAGKNLLEYKDLRQLLDMIQSFSHNVLQTGLTVESMTGARS